MQNHLQLEDAGLSAREAEIISLGVDGFTDKEIAAKLNVSITTVRTYWLRLRAKLGASSRTHAISIVYKQAVEEAALTSTSLHRLLRAAHLSLWTWELSSHSIRWEEPQSSFDGHSGIEITYTRFLARVHQEDRKVLQASLEKALRTGGKVSVEFRFHCKDGAPRHVSLLAIAELGKHGRRLAGITRFVSDMPAATVYKAQARKISLQ